MLRRSWSLVRRSLIYSDSVPFSVAEVFRRLFLRGERGLATALEEVMEEAVVVVVCGCVEVGGGGELRNDAEESM